MYQVPQNITTPKIFIVQRSETEGRLDARYYNENIHIPNYIRLASFASVKGGKRIPKSMTYSEKTTKYQYLRVADMDNENELSFEAMKYIDRNVFEILNRYEIKEGEFAISIAGTIGKVCYISHIPLGQRIILTENCAKILVKENEKIDIKYLDVLFKMPFIQKQLEMNYIQTTIPKLGIDKILSIKFPQFPNIKRQQEIANYYKASYLQKKKKESEAKQLLDSIDTYILDELGISLPVIRTDLHSRIFVVNRRMFEDRFDPKFNKDIAYIRDLSCVYPWISLDDVTIDNGQYGANEKAKDYQRGDVRYIRITDIGELGNLKESDMKTAEYIDSSYMLHKDDILFARSGSVGRCYIHKDMTAPAIFAGYLIRFVLNTNRINADYLFYYCNSKLYKYWVDTIQRPAVQANINAQEFRSMPIPLPPLAKQQEIADHISNLRQRAKGLQAEGNQILENAKKEVEQMIIG